MCTREMTLGEEIISLVQKGIEIPTVERMYRKYLEISSEVENERICEEYCKADIQSCKELINRIFGISNTSTIMNDIEVGDRITIALDGFGEFTATAHKVIGNDIMFIFDDYVTKRPMNANGTNNGGFEKSDLKRWLDTELLKAFPIGIRSRIKNLTVPSIGELTGWEDEWDKNHFEPDGDEQLTLMKKRRNRVAYFDNEPAWGWLRNAMLHEFSSASFADVNGNGITNYDGASGSYGVRPEFWLVK